MTVEHLHGLTLLRVTVSAGGVSHRRVGGDDPLVQAVFGDTAVPDARDWVVETGFFYNWLAAADGRRVGVEATLDIGRLTPADRAVLAASGLAVVGDSLVLRFTADAAGGFLPGTDCDSALVRTTHGLELLLGSDEETV